MNDTEAWREHQPVWILDRGDHRITDCTAGDLEVAVDAHDTHVFADHLAQYGAPDYMQEYFKRWAMHVEAPSGQLDRDAVARELSDYSVVMEQASIVYSELADLSKPNTAARYILAGAEQKYRETYADFLCDHAYSEENPEIKAAMIEIANGWNPTAWDEYCEAKDRLEAMLAAR